MRTVFIVELTEPVKSLVGVVSNKSIAFDRLETLSSGLTLVIHESSDYYAKFQNKQINYINFTKYFKEPKNKSKLVVSVVDPTITDGTQVLKTITCTMSIVNE